MYNNTLPKISIITPSLNQGNFLEETILSVINQDYPNIEYIIIDGGSADNSIEVIQKYENNITFWESRKDLGQSDAINKGLRKVTGEIIGIINSDDKYCPNVFNIIVDLFKSEDVKWIAGNVFFINEEGKVIKKKKPLYSPFILKYGSSSIYQPGVFIKREILEKIGMLNTSFHTIMDQEWFCRITEIYRPKVFDIDVAMFRWHKKSKSSSSKKTKHQQNYWRERKIIAERYNPNFKLGFPHFTKFHLFILEQSARIKKLYIRATVKRQKLK